MLLRFDTKVDDEVVRNQMAGMLDGMTDAQLLLDPERVEHVSIGGLPGIRIDGVAHGLGDRRGYSLIAVFATDHSYLIHCIAPVGTRVEHLEERLPISGKAYGRGQQIAEEVSGKINRGLPDLRKAIERVIRDSKKAHQPPRPTTASIAGGRSSA